MNKLSKRITILCGLLCASIGGLQAQTPGNIDTATIKVIAWLKSENYNDGTWINSIPGSSGSAGNFIAKVKSPLKVNSGYNFHPAVQFPKTTGASNSYWLQSQYDNSMTTSDNITTIFVLKRSTDNNDYDYLLAFNSSQNIGSILWYGNTSLRWRWENTDRIFTGDITEGIIVLDNANTSTPNINPYHNGVLGSFTSTGTGSGSGSHAATQKIAIASGRNHERYYGYDGDIQEIIILKTNGNGHLATADLRRIHSYLAIKYGITLNNTDPYVNSTYTGTETPPAGVIWDRVANNGYNNNIFGIGRDDASGLYQKQSHSDKNPGLTVFLGTHSVPPLLNSQNNGSLSNRQFLVMGSNNSKNIVSYSKPANTVYQNGQTDVNFTFRSEQVYKAQLTGIFSDSITVNFKVDRGEFSYVLVSTEDNIFDPTTTRAYPIVNGVAHRVDIGGLGTPYLYITFAGHSPGGVSDAMPAVWLKPETYNVNANTWTADYNNGTWTNKGIAGDFTAPDTPPMWKNSGYNFHPSVEFTKTSEGNSQNRMASANPYDIKREENVTAVFVLTKNKANTRDYLFAFSDDTYLNRDLMWDRDDFQLYWPNTAKATGITAQTGIITVDNANNTSDGFYAYENGTQKNTGTTAGYAESNGTLTLGACRDINVGFGYQGTIQEVILLKAAGNHLTDPDFKKVHSYLALKYGITLDGGNADYVNSTYTGNPSTGVIWDKNANAGYNNNIFGIGRDDASGLYQKQSHSDKNQNVTVFLGSKLTALNSQNNGTLSNGQFLVMGSNNNSNNTTPYSRPKNTKYQNGVQIDTLALRSVQVYKAQLTGIDSITVNIKNDRGEFFYVLVSTEGNIFDPTTTRAYPIVNGVAKGVNIGGSTGTYLYITFAGHTFSPGGVDIGNLRLWLDANISSSFSLSSLSKESTGISNYGDYEKTGENKSTSLTEIFAVQAWKDLTRDHTYEYRPGDYRTMPVYRDDQVEMNYHPSVHFWGATGSPSYTINNPVSYLKIYKGLLPQGQGQPQPNSRHTAIFVVNNAPPRDYKPNSANTQTDRSYYMGFGHSISNDDYNSSYDPNYGIRMVSGNTYTVLNTPGDAKINSSQASPSLAFKTGATSVVAYRTFLTGGATTPTNHTSKVPGPDDTNGRVIFNIDGQKSSEVPIYLSNLKMDLASTLGISYSYHRQLRGLISEVLIFEDTVSTTELKKIESYLAIKYGVTLRENDTTYNYQFSNGNIYWEGKSLKYSKYHHNVAAVIRDDAARLHNSQSHSTGAGSLLHIGVAGSRLGEDNYDVIDLENDMEAIVWGSNDSSGITLPVNDEHCGEFKEVFNRKWIVRKWTQGDRPVQLLVGAQNNLAKTIGGEDPGDREYYNVLDGSKDVVMLVADSVEKLDPLNAKFLTGGAQVVPMDYIGKENQCSYLFTDTVTYVTFAYKPSLRGCVEKKLSGTSCCE
jgi:hypothetical protein